jgi:hypothetical protein
MSQTFIQCLNQSIILQIAQASHERNEQIHKRTFKPAGRFNFGSTPFEICFRCRLHLKYGVTCCSYLDILDIVAPAEEEERASGLTVDKLRSVLKQKCPAYYDRVADWSRLSSITTRVDARCVLSMMEFRSAHGGSAPIPQRWWRPMWALRPASDNKAGLR